MAQNITFRTALFGGYNREDVEEYIKGLEHEMESIKLLHQKEKLELIRRADESESELVLVKSELEAAKKKSVGRDVQEEGESKAEEPVPVREDVQEAGEEDLEALKILEEEMQKDLNTKEDDKGDADLVLLQAECERLKKENGRLREQLENKDDLFDYDTVIKIMEEARTNAELIEKEAKERAEQMIEEAKGRALEEEDHQRHLIASRVNAQLEEKGIQLMAAKYKIEQYINEISNTQQGLYLLNTRMEKMVKDMPVRLDDYWEGEDFRQLEEKEEETTETE
ncbi:MAG: hypothetical protein KHX75_10805 [Lachnospiraceae bacterium]|nr:hypothetical protein [Lachnospiraceae bacterium]